MSWDDAKAEWWFAKTGERVPKGKVSEILRSIQGHPEAGSAWEHFICDILHSLDIRSLACMPSGRFHVRLHQ
jgi:hypothetical protein